MRTNLTRWTPALLLTVAGSSLSIAAGPFGPVVDLTTLDPEDGFVCHGVAAFSWFGYSVSGAGDLNGDGISDVLIGAPDLGRGFTYVLFGGSGFGAEDGDVSATELNGVNGYVINGIDPGDENGAAVAAAGDFNGDGIGDILIGAPDAEPNGEKSGETYVVYGGPGVGAGGSFDLSSLDGTNGFLMRGITAGDLSGRSVSSVGDINGDGRDDLIIGAHKASPNGAQSGESYIIFGGAPDADDGTVELLSLSGSNGFVLNGITGKDHSGWSVSGVGDVNNDGIDDLVIGARSASPNGQASGEAYVVFGAPGIGSGGSFELSTLNGANGFECEGFQLLDACGYAVAGAGDFNADGVDDVLIAWRTSSPNGQFSGSVYVLYGGAGIGASGSVNLPALDGTDGFVCNGIGDFDALGTTVAAAGDFNGDGYDDIMMRARQTSPIDGEITNETYVIFGGMGTGSSGVFEVSMIDGKNGVVLSGVGGDSIAGIGDFNNDGIDDVIIGDHSAELPQLIQGDGFVGHRGYDEYFDSAGATYMVYGRCGLPADFNSDGVVDTADLGSLIGQFGTAGPEADINGDGVVDTADLGAMIGAFGTMCP